MPSSDAFVTTLGMEVLSSAPPLSIARVTSLGMEVLVGDAVQSSARVTSVGMEVLMFDDNLSPGTDVLYAVVVAGRVTAILYGVLPMSTLSTLYIDISGIFPQPAVGWYYAEICNEFSLGAPDVPPGTVAPPNPTTPGGGGGGGGGPTTPGGNTPGPTAPASLVPDTVAFHARGDANLTIAAVPAVLTEINARLRTPYDFSVACAVHLQGHIVTGLAGAQIIIGYSTDGGTTWAPLSALGFGPVLPLASTGTIRGARTNVATGGSVIVSLFTRYGDGASNVVVGNLSMVVFNKTGAGSCVTIAETEVAPFSTVRVTSCFMEVLCRT